MFYVLRPSNQRPRAQRFLEMHQTVSPNIHSLLLKCMLWLRTLLSHYTSSRFKSIVYVCSPNSQITMPQWALRSLLYATPSIQISRSSASTRIAVAWCTVLHYGCSINGVFVPGSSSLLILSLCGLAVIKKVNKLLAASLYFRTLLSCRFMLSLNSRRLVSAAVFE